MNIGNRIHVQIAIEALDEGDYVYVLDGPCRAQKLRRVAKVVHGRKGQLTNHLEELRSGKYVLGRARKVGRDEVVSAWRWHKKLEEKHEVEG
jgi:hypothetical protein